MDSWVHFIAEDIQGIDSVIRLLDYVSAIDISIQRRQKPKVGQIFMTPRKRNHVYSVVIKERQNGGISLSSLWNTLRILKTTLQAEHANSFRISRRGDLTDSINPGELMETLTQIFGDSKIMLTVFYGKTEMPSVQERPVIIQNLLDSLVEP